MGFFSDPTVAAALKQIQNKTVLESQLNTALKIKEELKAKTNEFVTENEKIVNDMKELETTLKTTEDKIAENNAKMEKKLKEYVDTVKAIKERPEFCYQAKIATLNKELDNLKATIEKFKAAVTN